jgi:hypothetical protein
MRKATEKFWLDENTDWNQQDNEHLTSFYAFVSTPCV